MSKSQQEFVVKHLKKKGYLQQIQVLVERVNLLYTKKKYPLKFELIHGFCYEEEVINTLKKILMNIRNINGNEKLWNL